MQKKFYLDAVRDIFRAPSGKTGPCPGNKIRNKEISVEHLDGHTGKVEAFKTPFDYT